MLDNIECNYKDISEELSSICLGYNVNGISNEFERGITLILPTDRVKNKKNRVHAQISYASTPRTSDKDKGR